MKSVKKGFDLLWGARMAEKPSLRNWGWESEGYDKLT